MQYFSRPIVLQCTNILLNFLSYFFQQYFNPFLKRKSLVTNVFGSESTKITACIIFRSLNDLSSSLMFLEEFEDWDMGHLNLCPLCSSLPCICNSGSSYDFFSSVWVKWSVFCWQVLLSDWKGKRKGKLMRFLLICFLSPYTLFYDSTS